MVFARKLQGVVQAEKRGRLFDELKNQCGSIGFCSRQRRVSALAARLLLLVYNLWNLFVRLLEP